MNYYNLDFKKVIDALDSSLNGLSNSEVQNRLLKYGKNELPKKKKDNIFKIFLMQFYNPIEIILIITVILSFLVGETIDALAIIFIIIVDVLIGTYEEWKAKKDADSLIEMVKVTSKVLRNNEIIEIDSSNLVPGDIILLESGDKVPADGRIIECTNFQVDESSLTGESQNQPKNPQVLKNDPLLADLDNMVFASTSVVTGRAKVIVVKTGINTEIGKIADKVINTKEEKSPLTIRVEKFSKQISVLIVIIAFITAFVLIKTGYQVNEIFLCVVALAISAMPEGLPLALTMALTVASKRMLKKNVIVKKLNSVEALGSCTVIASDKTGTLTVNEQTAREIYLASGDSYKVTGTGYNDSGKIVPHKNSKLADVSNIITLGALNNEAHLELKDGIWKSYGDSIDIAFLSLAKKASNIELPNKEAMIPYESENQYSAVFYKKNGKLRCTVKGSIEKIMAFSKTNEEIQKANTDLTSKGYRVIAIADGIVKGTKESDIKALDFIGLVAFIDPIRDDAKASIKECSLAGIKVMMITGDHPLTAYAIAKDLGLCHKESEVATGKDISHYKSLGNDELDNFIKNIKVFSRVTPLDKLEIVESLKRQGEFVAVTGDGVNDAPAINQASIGIAMGSGTDVAKETAEMIVIDDSFSSIVEGIREGRCAYSNIRKIVLFLLSCGLAEVSFFLLAIAFGFDIPLVAIQLLWLNVVTDGLQDISLSLEKSDKDIMKEKPRPTKESIFSGDLIKEVLILGSMITIIVFGVWKYMMDNNVDKNIARSVIMMLMVVIQNLNVLSCRSEKNSIFKIPLFSNPILLITIIGSIMLQIIFSNISITSKFLQIVPLSFDIVLSCFMFAIVIIAIFEFYKIINKLFKKV